MKTSAAERRQAFNKQPKAGRKQLPKGDIAILMGDYLKVKHGLRGRYDVSAASTTPSLKRNPR